MPTAELLEFSLTVTDDAGADSVADTVSVSVAATNGPPTASAGPDQNVDEQTVVSLDGSGSVDGDGTVEEFAWTQTGGPAVSLSDPSAVNPSFTSPTVLESEGVQILSFSLVVTDDQGESSPPDSVSINVSPVNAQPVADAGIDWALDANEPGFLDGSASSDSDGSITAYSWTQTAV